MVYPYTKNLLIVYLKFKFNWYPGSSFTSSNMLLTVTVLFSYCKFQLQNFHLVLFYNFHFFILSIWWDTVIIASFNNLSMVSFSSLDMFIIAALKSLLSPRSVCSPLKAVSICLFLFLCIDHTFLFLCMSICCCCWNLDILENIL